MKRSLGIIEILVMIVFIVSLIIGILYLMDKQSDRVVQAKEVEKVEYSAPVEEATTQGNEELVYEGDEIMMREPEYYEALDLLARLIHCENSNEVDGEEACWKTGSVVINRIFSILFPNTLEEVVYQEGQYACIDDLYKEEPTDIEYEVAAELLNSGSILPENVLYAAEFIQADYVYDKVGNTYYCGVN